MSQPLRVVSAVCLLALGGAGCLEMPRSRSGGDSALGINPLEAMLRPPASATWQDGIAVLVLVDTSGSMRDGVKDADGQDKPKIEIARRCVTTLVQQMSGFVQQHPDRRLVVGIYEFSARDGEPSPRRVVRLGEPDPAAAAAAARNMVPSGGTPIGNAMIVAKRELDASGLARRHMLVITDGQNNNGYSPGDVADAIARQPAEGRAAIYFVAFDTAAKYFDAVKDAGGLVLAAANENDLGQTLDFILTGKILVEQPPAPASNRP